MQSFKLKNSDLGQSTIYLEKASATAINPGTLVALDANGLALTATNGSVKLAYSLTGAEVGTTKVAIVNDKDAILIGRGASNYAKNQRGVAYDMSVVSGRQVINQAATATTVLIMSAEETSDDGTAVGSLLNVQVRINKWIY